MQEALKNPHYKKIWEKVIMNRHPKVKSLKEALQQEIQHPHCIYILFGNLHITENDQIQPPIHESVIILARPITLEDILNIEPLRYYLTFYGHSQELEYDALPSGHSSHNVKVYNKIDWQLTKPLHEQTPETWEKIANLID